MFATSLDAHGSCGHYKNQKPRLSYNTGDLPQFKANALKSYASNIAKILPSPLLPDSEQDHTKTTGWISMKLGEAKKYPYVGVNRD